uniref:Uncharacterized protein n=1 Tax=Glossina austeni TaxID=7395 RepID=A0A1A9UFP3_GLOAU
MFPKRAWHWDVNAIIDCFLRFLLQFHWLTLFCNAFKCEEFEANISSIGTSGEDGKGKIKKNKNAKRSIPRTMKKNAKRRKCQRKSSADNKDSFNEGYNDAYDSGESDFEGCESGKNNEQEDEEIVRNNTYGPDYNDESIIIENDIHGNEDDPNTLRNTPFSKLHRSTADADLFLLNPSVSINAAVVMFSNTFRSLALKCSKMSVKKKLEIEQKAKKLFNKMRGRRGKYKNVQWDNLEMRQQSPFFWAALCDNDISCDPIENFQHFYVTTMTDNSSSMLLPIKKLKEHSLVIWHDMDARHRLPFIMQAFIAKIASGEVNANDCDELQTFIERIESTSD